jgi:leader peptidase (prepilin peptidase)/N-methyltransferase
VLLALVTAVLTAVLAYGLFALAGQDPRTILPGAGRLPLAVLAGVLGGVGSAVTEDPWSLPLVGVLAAFGVILGAIDARTKLLPNAMLIRFTAATLPLLVLASAADGQWSSLLWAAAGSAGLFCVYFLLALISPGGLGMGDVKLAAVLGLFGGWAGYAAWMGTLLGGFVLGALAGVGILLFRRGQRNTTFPFGPGMLLAAYASFVLLR